MLEATLVVGCIRGAVDLGADTEFATGPGRFLLGTVPVALLEEGRHLADSASFSNFTAGLTRHVLGCSTQRKCSSSSCDDLELALFETLSGGWATIMKAKSLLSRQQYCL